jgi:hypothetical protein
VVRWLTIITPLILIVGYVGGVLETYFKNRRDGRRVIKKDLKDVFSRKVFRYLFLIDVNRSFY